MEGITDISQILEEIQMIFVNIQDHTDLREEMQKTVRVFACFGNKVFRVAHTDISADGFQDSAYGDRRVQFSGEKNV